MAEGVVTVPVSGWQIASTIGTFLAVAVALAVVVINLVQRHNDRCREEEQDENRALAQARLVVTGHGNPGVNSRGAHPRLLLPVTNYSDRPILRVIGEHWPAGRPLDEQPGSVIEPVIQPGDTCQLAVPMDDDGQAGHTAAWRIRWTDADGREWCWDRWPQEAPDRYTGQTPTPY